MRSAKMIVVAVMMWGLALVACGASPAQEIPPEYNAAHAQAVKLDKPLLVLCGAEWCGPCKEVARYESVFRSHGAYVHIDIDRWPTFSGGLLLGRQIPTLIIFHRREGRWTDSEVITCKEPIATWAEQQRRHKSRGSLRRAVSKAIHPRQRCHRVLLPRLHVGRAGVRVLIAGR